MTANTDLIKKTIIGVTALTTVVAGAYTTINLYKGEKDYSTILVESAKKYVEENNLAIGAKYVATVSRLKDSGALAKNAKVPSNACVTVKNENGELSYDASSTCETVTFESEGPQSLGYKVITSSDNLTNKFVEVRVLFEEEVQSVEVPGWTISSDKLEIVKLFTKNEANTLSITSLNGEKTASVDIDVKNIDTEAPEILVNGQGIMSNYDSAITLNVDDANLDNVTLNGNELEVNSIDEEGTYEVVAKDLAGNKSVAQFSLNRNTSTLQISTPATNNFVFTNEKGIIYETSGGSTKVYYCGASGDICNDLKSSTSGGFLSNPKEGRYKIEVTGDNGKKLERYFIYDKTNPTISVTDSEGKTIVNGGSTNKDVNISFSDAYSPATATIGKVGSSDTTTYTSGFTWKKEGTYKIVVRDGGTNNDGFHTIEFTFTINKTAPTISGVGEGQHYKSVAPTFASGLTATLDGSRYTSGTTISSNGEHTLVVTDTAGNSTTVKFYIDNIRPTITIPASREVTHIRGEEWNGYTVVYSDNLTPKSELQVSITKGGISYSNPLTEDGIYTITVKDKAGNTREENLTIKTVEPIIEDKTAPLVTISSTDYSNSFRGTANTIPEVFTSDVTFRANETGCTYRLNGSVYTSTTISKSGEYTLRVTDKAGNETAITFTILKEKPVLKLQTTENDEVNEVTIKNEGTYYLNKQFVVSIENYNTVESAKITDEDNIVTNANAEGKIVVTPNPSARYVYDLVVMDKAGIETTATIIFDNVAPTSTVAPITTNSTIEFVDEAGSGIKTATIEYKDPTTGKYGEPTNITSGYSLPQQGDYKLTLIDNAGNKATYDTTLDTSDPVIKFYTSSKNENNETIDQEVLGQEINGKIYFSKPVKLNFSDAYSFIKVTKKGIQEDQDEILVNNITTQTNMTKTYSTDYLADGTYTYVVEDQAGHKVPVTIVVDTHIDEFAIEQNPQLNADTQRVESVTLFFDIDEDEEVNIEDKNDGTNGKPRIEWTQTVLENGLRHIEAIINDTLGVTINGTVTVTDKAGNTASANYSVLVDKIAPDIRVVTSDTKTNAKSIEIELYSSKHLESITDDASFVTWKINKETGKLIEETVINKDNGKTEYKYTAIVTDNVENHTITVKDTTKNTNTTEYSVSNIDRIVDLIGNETDGYVTYDIISNAKVKATIKSREPLTMPAGWEPSYDEQNKIHSYSLVYEANDTYSVEVQDALGNSKTVEVKITQIDTDGPTIGGIAPNDKLLQNIVEEVYAFGTDVTPIFTDDCTEVTLNKISADGSEVPVTFAKGDSIPLVEGEDTLYILRAYDDKENLTSVKVRIDNKAPELSVTYFKSDKTTPVNVSFDDNGNYTGDYINTDLIIRFTSEETIKLPENHSPNLNKAIDADENEIENTYDFRIFSNYYVPASFEDEFGNVASWSTRVNCIDKTKPIITGVENDGNGKYTIANISDFKLLDVPIDDETGLKGIQEEHNYTVTIGKNSDTPLITFNKGELTSTTMTKVGNKNVLRFATTSGNQDLEDGYYRLEVEDAAHTKVVVYFTLDINAPEIVLPEGFVEDENGTKTYNKQVMPVFREGDGILYVNPVYDSEGNVISDDKGSINDETIDRTFKSWTTIQGYTEIDGVKTYTDETYLLVVTDKNGNISEETFRIDRIAPSVLQTKTNAQEGHYFVKSPGTITFTMSEKVTLVNNQSSNITLSDDGLKVSVRVTGNYPIYVRVADTAGNTYAISHTVDFIDNNKPVVYLNEDTTNKGLYNADVKIEITDYNENGVYDERNKVVATIEGGEYKTPQPIESGKTISADGDYILTVTDDAGNTVTHKFTIDKTAPTIEMPSGYVDDNGIKLYNKQVMPVFREGTGILYINPVFDSEGNITSSGEAFKSWTTLPAYTLDDQGNRVYVDKTYALVVTDKAGNKAIENFRIDTVKPEEPAITGDETPTNQTVILTIKFAEPVKMLTDSPNFIDKPEEGTLSDTYQLKVFGNYPVYLSYQDTAGNKGGYLHEVTCIDRTNPIGEIIKETVDNTVKLTLKVDEEIKDIVDSDSSVTWTPAGPKTENVLDADGNPVLNEDGTKVTKTYYLYTRTATANTKGSQKVTYTDLAGNPGEVEYIVDSIDMTGPDVQITSGTYVETYDIYSSDVTLTITDDIGFTGYYVKDGSQVSISDTAIKSKEVTLDATGTYEITVTDGVHPAVTKTIIIDKEAPVIVGTTQNSEDKVNDTLFKNSVTVTITEPNILSMTVDNVDLTENKFWTTKTFESGKHTISVTDKCNRTTEYSFKIYKDAPVITFAEDSGVVIDEETGEYLLITIKGNKDSQGNTRVTIPSATATDAVGNTLTVSSSTWNDDNFNTSGNYTITYTSEEDPVGVSSTKNLTVRVLNVDRYYEIKAVFDRLEKNTFVTAEDGTTYQGNFYTLTVENKYDYKGTNIRYGIGYPGDYDYKKAMLDSFGQFYIDGLIPFRALHDQAYMDSQIKVIDDLELIPEDLYLNSYNAQLTIISGLKSTDYTADSWKSLSDYKDEAAAYLASTTTRPLQSGVNRYEQGLRKKIADLVNAPYDDETASYKEKYLSEDYSGYDKYIQDLDLLHFDVLNNHILKSVYESRLTTIEKTLLATKLPIDPQTYNQKLQEFNAYNKADYTETSWNKVKKQLDDVNTIIQNQGLRSEYRKALEKVDFRELKPLPKATDINISVVGKANKGYAIEGDKIVITFESNVDLALKSNVTEGQKYTTATINGVEGIEVTKNADDLYEASLTISDSPTQGTANYTLSLVGPDQLEVDPTSPASTGITVDTILDEPTISKSITVTTQGPIDVILTANEALVIDGWRDTSTIEPEKHEYRLSVSENVENATVTYKDLAGNEKTLTYSVTNIDSTNPTATITPNTEDPTPNDVTLTLKPSEAIQNIVTTDEEGQSYSWTKATDKNEYTLTISENKTIKVTFEDKVGREGKAEYTVSNIDKDAPTISFKEDTKVVYDNMVVVSKDTTIDKNLVETLVTLADKNGANLENPVFSENVDGIITATVKAEDSLGNVTADKDAFIIRFRIIDTTILDEFTKDGGRLETLKASTPATDAFLTSENENLWDYFTDGGVAFEESIRTFKTTIASLLDGTITTSDYLTSQDSLNTAMTNLIALSPRSLDETKKQNLADLEKEIKAILDLTEDELKEAYNVTSEFTEALNNLKNADYTLPAIQSALNKKLSLINANFDIVKSARKKVITNVEVSTDKGTPTLEDKKYLKAGNILVFTFETDGMKPSVRINNRYDATVTPIYDTEDEETRKIVSYRAEFKIRQGQNWKWVDYVITSYDLDAEGNPIEGSGKPYKGREENISVDTTPVTIEGPTYFTKEKDQEGNDTFITYENTETSSTRKNVYVTITSKEEIADIKHFDEENGETEIAEDLLTHSPDGTIRYMVTGNKTGTLNIYDLAGNKTSVEYTVQGIDKDPIFRDAPAKYYVAVGNEIDIIKPIAIDADDNSLDSSKIILTNDVTVDFTTPGTYVLEYKIDGYDKTTTATYYVLTSATLNETKTEITFKDGTKYISSDFNTEAFTAAVNAIEELNNNITGGKFITDDKKDLEPQDVYDTLVNVIKTTLFANRLKVDDENYDAYTEFKTIKNTFESMTDEEKLTYIPESLDKRASEIAKVQGLVDNDETLRSAFELALKELKDSHNPVKKVSLESHDAIVIFRKEKPTPVYSKDTPEDEKIDINDYANYAKKLDTIQVTFTTKDELLLEGDNKTTVSIEGVDCPVTLAASADGIYTYTASWQIRTDGDREVTYTIKATRESDNNSITVTPEHSNVFIDTTVPAFDEETLVNPEGFTNTYKEVSIKVDEPVYSTKSSAKAIVNEDGTTTLTAKLYVDQEYTFWAVDYAGNSMSYKVNVTGIDKNPVTSDINYFLADAEGNMTDTLYNQQGTNQAVYIQISTNKEMKSIIDAEGNEWSLEDSTGEGTNKPHIYTYKVTEDLTATTLTLTDVYGNVQKNVPVAVTGIDTVAPKMQMEFENTTFLDDKTYTNAVKVTITEGILTDNGTVVADFDTAQDKVDGKLTVRLTGNGQHTIVLTDKVGNKKSTTIYFDSAAPNVTFKNANDEVVTLTNSIFLEKVKLIAVDEVFGTDVTITDATRGELTAGELLEDGHYEITVSDVLENTTESYVFDIDSAAPSITVAEDPAYKDEENIKPTIYVGKATVTISDDKSLTKVTYKKDNGEEVDITPDSGSSITEELTAPGRYTITASDGIHTDIVYSFILDTALVTDTTEDIKSAYDSRNYTLESYALFTTALDELSTKVASKDILSTEYETLKDTAIAKLIAIKITDTQDYRDLLDYKAKLETIQSSGDEYTDSLADFETAIENADKVVESSSNKLLTEFEDDMTAAMDDVKTSFTKLTKTLTITPSDMTTTNESTYGKFAIPGDTVTVNFTTKSRLTSAIVNINGVDVTVDVSNPTVSEDGKTFAYTASYTIVKPSVETPNARMTYKITAVRNDTTSTTEEITSNIILDTTLPSPQIEMGTIGSNLHTQYVKVTITEGILTDNGEVIANFDESEDIVDGKLTVTIEGQGAHTLELTDKAGNKNGMTVYLDSVAPNEVTFTNESGEVVTMPENKVFLVPIKISATDAISGSNVTITDKVLGAITPNTLLGEGHYEITIADELGNTTEPYVFDIDLDAPVITAIKDSATKRTTITITDSKELAYAEYSFNGGDRQSLNITDGKTAELTLSTKADEGTYVFYAKDKSGRDEVSKTVVYDITAPDLTITYNNVAYSTDFHVTLNASNDSFNPENYFTVASEVTPTVTHNVVLNTPTTTTPYEVTYTVSDDEGNTNTLTIYVHVDDGAPTIEFIGDDVITVPYGTTFTDPGAQSIDSVDGTKTIYATDSADIDTYDTTKTQYITYTATDSNGNTATKKRTVKVDTTGFSSFVRTYNKCSNNKGVACYMTGVPRTNGELNNYVWYSGRMWRMIKINSGTESSTNDFAQSIQLIADDSQTGFSYSGASSKFEGSYADVWLNTTFYNSLNNADEIVSKQATFCNQTNATNNNYLTCSANAVARKVGLITVDDYRAMYNYLSARKISFVSKGDRFFTMTPSADDKVWIVYENGATGYNNATEPYALRPVININPTTTLIKGNGSANNPFVFDEGNNIISENTLLTSRSTGEYVSFGGKTWRIVSHDENGTKLITDDFLKVDGEYVSRPYETFNNFNTTTGIGKYLHENVYETLNVNDKALVVNAPYNNNKYTFAADPNASGILTNGKNVNAYVGLIRVGELMSGSTNTTRKQSFSSWTMTSANQKTWFITNAGTAEYADASTSRALRPVITLDSSVYISGGDGTQNSPFEIRK